MYARMAVQTGRFGLVGVVLVAIAWTFFGVVLSLYAALLLPWLVGEAPALVATRAPFATESSLLSSLVYLLGWQGPSFWRFCSFAGAALAW